MLVTALIAMSPMAVFMGAVGTIIAAPHIKRSIKYKYDCLTKGKSNPEHDTYSIIIGSMVHNAEEWKFDRDQAVWPRPEQGKYQIMLTYDASKDELDLSLMRDGGKFHRVEGYWATMFKQCMREQAARIQTKAVYKQLFPNGAPQLLLTKG